MVSVIIPTYRPLSYIWDCLDSIVQQTLDKDNFEVIIVLNGCKEPYYSQIQLYLSNITTCSVSLLQTDVAGVSNARNIGLDNAKGEYVVFIDDDDVVSNNYLYDLYHKVKGKEDVIVVANIKNFINEIFVDVKSNDYLGKCYEKYHNSNVNSIFILRSFLSSACGKIIPLKVIKNRRFETILKLGEDSLFMAEVSDSIVTILFSDEDTIYYRRLRDGSASRTRQCFVNRMKNCLREWKCYLVIYLKSPIKYNFLFFLSRFIAVFIRNIVKC